MRYLLIFFALLDFTFCHSTWWGPTGLIQVPTTTIVREKETSVSSYIAFSGQDDYLGLNANFAFSDTLELSISDTMGYDQRKGASTVFSAKYVPVSNFAVGVMLDSNSNYKNTLYSVLGSPENSVYLGAGLNFGNGGAKRALLGNYSSVKGDMENLFFLAGARMDLSNFYPSLEAMVEFNGDTMSVGLGYIPQNNWDMQLDYMSSGDLFPDDQFVLSFGTKF